MYLWLHFGASCALRELGFFTLLHCLYAKGDCQLHELWLYQSVVHSKVRFSISQNKFEMYLVLVNKSNGKFTHTETHTTTINATTETINFRRVVSICRTQSLIPGTHILLCMSTLRHTVYTQYMGKQCAPANATRIQTI